MIQINEDTKLAFCTACQTAHVFDGDEDENRKCLNCGEKDSLYFVQELIDIANDYKQLKVDYHNVCDLMYNHD